MLPATKLAQNYEHLINIAFNTCLILANTDIGCLIAKLTALLWGKSKDH